LATLVRRQGRHQHDSQPEIEDQWQSALSVVSGRPKKEKKGTTAKSRCDQSLAQTAKIWPIVCAENFGVVAANPSLSAIHLFEFPSLVDLCFLTYTRLAA